MKRDSFILYTEINEVVKELSDEQKGKLFQAILDYEETGEMPEMDVLVKCVFLPIKRDLDKNDEKWRETARKRSEAGKKGMASRYNKDNNDVTNDNNVITNDNYVKNDLTNVTVYDNDNVNVNVNDNNIKTIPPKAADDERFETFWKTYPKKVGKKDAQRAWKKIKPDKDLFDRIIKAVTDWKDSDQWTKDGGQYIPNPATWLNRGSWDDEIPKVRAPVKKNQFSNFPQRGYTETDYKELERKMLTERRRTG